MCPADLKAAHSHLSWLRRSFDGRLIFMYSCLGSRIYSDALIHVFRLFNVASQVFQNKGVLEDTSAILGTTIDVVIVNDVQIHHIFNSLKF